MTTFVTTTGIHKSGNSWLVAMIGKLLNSQADDGLSLNRFFCLHDLLSAIRSCPQSAINVTPQDWAMRLLNPGDSNRIDRDKLSLDSLNHLAKRIRWNMARANREEFLNLEEIHLKLADRCFTTEFESAGKEICFVASKHMPLRTLGNQFDRFKQIWILRDPRDALVSWFYHDMGVLTEDKLAWFVNRDDAGRVQKLDTWREAFLKDRISRQLRFYNISSAKTERAERLGHSDSEPMIVRYEDMLQSPVDVLARIVEFVGMPVDLKTIEQVTTEYSFKKITGSGNEQKGSFIRKGTSGDWKNYFSAGDNIYFDQEYCDMLVRLGYETDNHWLTQLCEQPEQSFDLKRFRLRSSAVYNAMHYWLGSLDLQKQFPRPFEFAGASSFFKHLQSTKEPSIFDWLKGVDAVFDTTGELDKRHDADQLLGY